MNNNGMLWLLTYGEILKFVESAELFLGLPGLNFPTSAVFRIILPLYMEETAFMYPNSNSKAKKEKISRLK